MKREFQAVLFDLDGTLLHNPMDVFLPRYFQALAARVRDLMPAEAFVQQLLRATQAMIANDGHQTNEAVFSAAFYPLAGRRREELQPLFDDFYACDYPALRSATQPIPEARGVVQQCFDAGCDVVIATNPLFPTTAIYQRLEWAGVADFPYRWVTTYENSRACKPNPRYFQEIVDLLGYPPEACLMVGNEALDLAAARIGCRTFMVGKGDTGEWEPTYRGTLGEVAGLLV